MQILTVTDLHQPLSPCPRRVALGVFDGLHIGHHAVLSHTLDGFDRPCVLTFSHAPKADSPLLGEQEEARRLEQLGIAEWIRVDFSLIRHLSPEAFVTDFLHRTLGAVAVCCGYNYRFGKDRCGDADMLVSLCASVGIDVTVVPPVLCGEEPISSTRIREALAKGDMALANRLLGRPFSLTAAVEHGKHLGKKLGFPTINQAFSGGRFVPRRGVYASFAVLDGKVTFGVTNVGRHPTVNQTAAPLAETWFPDWSGDLYGQTVTIFLSHFLRPEQTFSSVDALTAQVKADAEKARHLWEDDPNDRTVKAVLFDFDDTLHDRRAAFYSFSLSLLERFFPDSSPDWRKERATEMRIVNNGGYVPSYEWFYGEMLSRWEWPPEATVDTLCDIARRRFPDHVCLFADTVSTLIALRQRGYRLGILTNGHSLMQNRKIEVSGLRPLMDAVMVSGDVGVQKPDGEIFRRLAACVGVPPHQCLFVGDYVPNDLVGAQNGGMQPLYMDAFDRHEADESIPRITALSQLLEILP